MKTNQTTLTNFTSVRDRWVKKFRSELPKWNLSARRFSAKEIKCLRQQFQLLANFVAKLEGQSRPSIAFRPKVANVLPATVAMMNFIRQNLVRSDVAESLSTYSYIQLILSLQNFGGNETFRFDMRTLGDLRRRLDGIKDQRPNALVSAKIWSAMFKLTDKLVREIEIDSINTSESEDLPDWVFMSKAELQRHFSS